MRPWRSENRSASRNGSADRNLSSLSVMERPLSVDLSGIHSDLLAAARGHMLVTYGELMKKHHLSRGRRLSQTIGEIDRVESENGMPGFAAIIVRKDTGFPGGGYFCDSELPPPLRRRRSDASDPRLSAVEIRYLKRQQHRIWACYGSR